MTRVETLTNNEKIEVYQTNYNILENYEYHENILGQNPTKYFYWASKEHQSATHAVILQEIFNL